MLLPHVSTQQTCSGPRNTIPVGHRCFLFEGAVLIEYCSQAAPPYFDAFNIWKPEMLRHSEDEEHGGAVARSAFGVPWTGFNSCPYLVHRGVQRSALCHLPDCRFDNRPSNMLA